MIPRRVVTLAETDLPGLEQVRHRRRQLFVLLTVVFGIIAGGLVAFSYGAELLGAEPLDLLNADVLRISFAVLVIAFGAYVWAKERALGRAEHALIEERVLSAALENRVSELNVILRAGRAVASTLSLEDVLDLILHSAGELLGATEGSVMLFDDAKERLRIAASQGLAEEATQQSIPIGEGVAGWVAEFREAVILSGEVDDPRFRRFIPKDRTVRSAMSAPLYARAEPVGVLNVSVSTGEREYTEHDLRALTVFAEHAAIAINNARLFERERAASSRLVELDARRREFLAVVTHDLKAPLTSILGYVRLLLDLGEAAPPEQSRQFAEVIEQQGNRMLEMIEQLVVATGAEEGSLVLARERLDLRRLVEDQASAFGGVLGARSLEVHVPDELPTVYGDSSAIQHVLANLLDNAVKYSQEGSPVEVQIIELDGEVAVRVSDRGRGIPQEMREEIFERYRRVDGQAEGASVGLGLFIVRSLVQAHGGRVWAENREDGGARVTFTLPLRKRDEPDGEPGR